MTKDFSRKTASEIMIVLGVDSLSDANLTDVNLRYANLSNANLTDANLRYASLRGANLSDADLSDANLRYAGLRYADLSGADLRGANLSGADLTDVDLSGVNISNSAINDVARLDFGGWSICVYKDKTSIGCQTRPNNEWLELTGDEEWVTKINGAREFWLKHRDAICATICTVMSDSNGV